MENLSPGFSKETGHDLTLPEYVALHFIYKMFKKDRDTLATIIWDKENRPRKLKQVLFNDLIKPLFKKGGKAVEELQNYYSENKLTLRQAFKAEINGDIFEIKRADNLSPFR